MKLLKQKNLEQYNRTRKRFDSDQLKDIKNSGEHPNEVMILAKEFHSPKDALYDNYYNGTRYMFNNPKDIIHYAEIYAKYPQQVEGYLNEMRKDIDKLYKTKRDGYTLQLLYDKCCEQMDALITQK